MIYPEFLREGSKIGITAPSCGIPEEKRPLFELSLSNIKNAGFDLSLTDNVYKCGKIASTPGDVRANELLSLTRDDSVKLVWAASGGDMLVEMLEHIDYEEIKKHPKWYMGYSDITGLIFPITLNCDMATIYGPNAGGLDMTSLHPSLKVALETVKGNIPVQKAYPLHERHRVKGSDGYSLDTPTEWDSTCGDFSASGRLIGGCIDCLQFFVGTRYGNVTRFITKYAQDGVIWYFDNFALTAEAMYYALWNMKNAGWFENTKAVMISRVLFPGTAFELSYKEAAVNALGDIPVVLETDTGHVKPQFTLINGSYATLDVSGKSGSLTQKLI
ncbi:MAG: LD-carboxypeptidase [Clostridia bacterium]|nr:LD-carboxypeptidase [Clostridia bacterium]